MNWFGKISQFFKAVVLLDHKISQLVEVVKRLDLENRELRERVVVLESQLKTRHSEEKTMLDRY